MLTQPVFWAGVIAGMLIVTGAIVGIVAGLLLFVPAEPFVPLDDQ